MTNNEYKEIPESTQFTSTNILVREVLCHQSVGVVSFILLVFIDVLELIKIPGHNRRHHLSATETTVVSFHNFSYNELIQLQIDD